MSAQVFLIKKLTRDYFSAFSEKSLPKIQAMFAKNIMLRDWDISAQGYDAVCAANQNIFDSVRTIHVDPINIYVDGLTAIGEIKITVNDEEIIKVVDLIEWDEELKIISIKAFKG